MYFVLIMALFMNSKTDYLPFPVSHNLICPSSDAVTIAQESLENAESVNA